MFTNPMKREWKHLWNNKEYIFPPESTVPLIIPTETLENIQEIRKRFAKDLALDRVYEGEVTPSGFDYNKAKEMGRGMPPTFDEKILEPFIQECLKPMPVKRMNVQKGKEMDDDRRYKATKAGFKGSPAELFTEDENREELGVMPDHA